jgi:hypothetical protein
MAKTFLLAILLLTLTLFATADEITVAATAFSPTRAGLRRSDIVEEKAGGARICGVPQEVRDRLSC